VIEYLIRTVDEHEMPFAHGSSLTDMLLPPGFGCEEIDGWGNFRMRCGATEISFSAEDPGWQVGFEGPLAEPDCERLIVVIIEQLGQLAGEACEWLRIS
jgi:hypothetical protein